MLSGKSSVIKFNKSSAVAETGGRPFGHNRHGLKSGELLCLFPWGGAGSPSNTVWPAPRPNSVPCGILIHPAVWPQWTWAKNWEGAAVPPFVEGELGPYLRQCGLGRDLPLYQWRLDPSSILATTDMGREVGGCCAPFGGGAGSPSNTMSPGLRPTCVPSGILIHPSVWPQYTDVTDRQTGQTDNCLIA